MTRTRIVTDCKKLRELRIMSGYSKVDIAKEAGVTVTTYHRIENAIAAPSPRSAKAIADTLHVSFKEIFQIEDYTN